jgi:hypothetical protein
MHMDMAMTTTPKSTTSSPGAYVAKPPPPPPGYVVHNKAAAAAAYDSCSGRHGGAAATATSRASAARHDYDDRHQQAGARALDGLLLLLRAAASVMSFVAVALVASCRHGDWMEFARYPEYRCLLGASVLACVYSAAQALRGFRRSGGGLAGFAGDQVVAYLLITASAAALPITLRMRSAVLNVFTDAMTAAISLGFIAFAALALSAMLSGFTLSAAAQPY